MGHSADVVNVTYVSGRWKTHFEKQALVAGTKQSKQANKADRPTRQSDLSNLFQACLLCFVPATNAIVLLKWMFHKIICVFFGFAGSGSGQSVLIWTDPEYRESKETVLCPLGWK
jgi:hypothetical protein